MGWLPNRLPTVQAALVDAAGEQYRPTAYRRVLGQLGDIARPIGRHADQGLPGSNLAPNRRAGAARLKGLLTWSFAWFSVDR